MRDRRARQNTVAEIENERPAGERVQDRIDAAVECLTTREQHQRIEVSLHRAPRLAGLTAVAAFASLGLPGLAGFVAEIQVFAGTLAVYPWLAGVGLLGIVLTAALFLRMLGRVFLGPLAERWQAFGDLSRREALALGGLLALVVVGILVWQGRSVSTRLGALALAMIVGGAIGNVLDRAFRGDDGFMSGAVVDFIDLQWWPVFNVADIGIVVGGLLLVLVAARMAPDGEPG